MLAGNFRFNLYPDTPIGALIRFNEYSTSNRFRSLQIIIPIVFLARVLKYRENPKYMSPSVLYQLVRQDVQEELAGNCAFFLHLFPDEPRLLFNE